MGLGTFGSTSKSSEAHPDDSFYDDDLRKHGRQIQMNYWVPVGEYQRHEKAVNALKKHFKTTSTQEAIVKGVQYAAKTLARGRK